MFYDSYDSYDTSKAKNIVSSWATLKPGNRKPECGTGIRNRKPESGIWKPQITENKFFKLVKIILHSFCR